MEFKISIKKRKVPKKLVQKFKSIPRTQYIIKVNGIDVAIVSALISAKKICKYLKSSCKK